jgi:hypothetical protein
MFHGNPFGFVNTNVPVAVQSQLGTYLHVWQAQAKDGQRISTWSWVDQPNLKWFVETVQGRNDVFHISSALNRDFVVHQQGATSNNGDPVTLWNKRTHGQQGNLQVRFEPSGDGWWFIRFVHSGKCVHVQGAATANDTPVTQWDSVPQANLKWRFVPAAGADPNVHNPAYFPGVKVAVQSALGTFLHVYGGVASDGARISTWSWVDQPNLKWHIEPVPNFPGRFFLVTETNPSFVLHQQGATNDNGGPCTTWNKNTHGHQGNLQVTFEPAGGEYWYIRFAHSGKYVHVQGAVTSNDGPVTQWDRVDQPNLKWRFIPVA